MRFVRGSSPLEPVHEHDLRMSKGDTALHFLFATTHAHPLHHVIYQTYRGMCDFPIFRVHGNNLLLHGHAAVSPGVVTSHTPIVGDSVRCMDIDPQAVIDALSRQIGALQTENTILKMALQQQQEEVGAVASVAPVNEGKKGK